MLVKDRMASPAVTVAADAAFQEALKLMRDRKFRRLPVVDASGKLVGILSERDLLHASPSPATSLSVWEVNYLLWKLKVGDIMTHNVFTINQDAPLEEAAAMMVSYQIGGMPVVDDKGRVVGVITETDIFKAFVEMLGGQEKGLRLTLMVPIRRWGAGEIGDGDLRAGRHDPECRLPRSRIGRRTRTHHEGARRIQRQDRSGPRSARRPCDRRP